MEKGVDHRLGCSKTVFVTMRFLTFVGWDGKLLKGRATENASSAIGTKESSEII